MKIFTNDKTAEEGIFVKPDESLPENLVLMIGKDSFVVANLETGLIRHWNKQSLLKIKSYAQKLDPITVELADFILNELKNEAI